MFIGLTSSCVKTALCVTTFVINPTHTSTYKYSYCSTVASVYTRWLAFQKLNQDKKRKMEYATRWFRRKLDMNGHL